MPIVKNVNKYVPLPINDSNIEGLIKIKKMKTEDSLKSIGIKLRPLNRKNIEEAVKLNSFKTLRTILVGAGKIGTAHFQNLKEFPQINLSAIVEKDVGKAKLLWSFGDKVPVFPDIAEAIKDVKPDVAIICTPTFTHYPILKECLKSGVNCFVEKPLSLNNEENEKIKSLVKKTKNVKVSVGYLTSHYKHIKYLRKNLKKFGKVKSVEAFYRLSHILDGNARGWETQKLLSGGGVIVNAGIHLINTICTILGAEYSILKKETKKIFSKEVEDSLKAEMTIGNIPVKLDFNWSVQGYLTSELFIKMETGKGSLLIDNLGFVFYTKKGRKEFSFSDTEEIRFNFSPESGMSGFFSEIESFLDCLIKGKNNFTDVSWASKIETIAQELTK